MTPRCLCEQCKMTVEQCRGKSAAKSGAVLEELEKRISDRIGELKKLLPCQNEKELCKVLALIGENQAMWSQIRELRQKER